MSRDDLWGRSYFSIERLSRHEKCSWLLFGVLLWTDNILTTISSASETKFAGKFISVRASFVPIFRVDATKDIHKVAKFKASKT